MSPAAKRWTVYRRGEALGTFTATEIREQLRKGVLSPADFASEEGSRVQQEIIEIDAIFGTSDEAQLFREDSPRKSRWAKKAEEMNFKSSPPTRPRPERLDRGQRRGHGEHRRHGAGRNRRTDGKHMHNGDLQNNSAAGPKGSDTVLTSILVLAAGALAAVLFWLLRARS